MTMNTDDGRAARIADARRRDEQADAERARDALSAAVAVEARRQGWSEPERVYTLLPELDPADAAGIRSALERLGRDRPGLRTAARSGGTPPGPDAGRPRPRPLTPGEMLSASQAAERARAELLGLDLLSMRGRYSM